MAGVALVDRKGRKFLLSVGSAGIVGFLLAIGAVFLRSESQRIDCRAEAQRLVTGGQTVHLALTEAAAAHLLADAGEAGRALAGQPKTLSVIYAYGDFRAASPLIRSDDPAGAVLDLRRDGCVPPNRIVAFFTNPFADLATARTAPLRIEHALITRTATEANGWLTLILVLGFVASFAIGPGVCVWLALSELMPTRIRSNGMSAALLINQAVSTVIAAVFLPTVGRHGYSTMFFLFAGATVVYLMTAVFFLPETKGKTLEEIEEYFERGRRRPAPVAARPT
jgi:hypothetical protein